jgi:hypothetical protein
VIGYCFDAHRRGERVWGVAAFSGSTAIITSSLKGIIQHRPCYATWAGPAQADLVR